MNQKTWEFDTFVYANVNNAEIYADLCRIYEGCGAFFYKENKLISSIFCDIENVYAIGKERYCVKTKDHSNSFYLERCSKEEITYVEGDQVIPNKDGLADNLTFAFAHDDTVEERLREDIQKKYVWNVIGVSEEHILLLQKGEETQFLLSKEVKTLEVIKENAIQLRKIKEKKNG